MVYRYLNIILFLMVFNIIGFAKNIPGPFLFYPSNYSNYIQTNKLQLSWLKIDGEDFYKVQYSLDSNFIPSSINENIVKFHTDVTISDLLMTTTYFWRVKVDKDSSNWSDVWRFTTTGNPIIPNLIQPINMSNNQNQIVEFSWKSSNENKRYIFHLSNQSNFSDTVKLIEQSDTLIEVGGFRTNTTYYWHVKSYNVDGLSSSWSDNYQFRTVLATPKQIFPQNYTNNIDTVLTLRWSDVPAASNFNVLLSTDVFFENEQDNISSNILTNKFKIDSLRTNTIYYWKILAINAFTDSSNWSDVYRFKTKIAPPNLIFPSDSTNNINNSLTFKWKSNSDFDNYNIQIALDNNFNSIIFGEELSGDSIAVTLNDWTKYYWRVSGKNNLGDFSSWSKTNQFKTMLSKPELIVPIDNSYFITTNYNFIWQKVTGANEYRFQLSEFQNYSTLLFDKTVVDSFLVVDSLSLNSTYYWRIMASNDQRDSSNWSNSYKLTTTSIVVETDSIFTELNYSVNPTDTIGTLLIHNYGINEAIFSSIFTMPDSIYYSNISSLTIQPYSSKSIILFGDTTKIDTGFYFGTLSIIHDETLSTADTIIIPITTYAMKSSGIIRSDSLNYDTVSVASKVKTSFMLSNRNGNYPLEIIDFQFANHDSTAFKIVQLPQVIEPGDSNKIIVEFKPTALDSNTSKLILETNSYPNKYFEITLTGIGKGGSFSEATLNSLIQLSDTTFETLTNNNKEVLFFNNGNSQITFSTRFVENYFRQIEKKSNIRLNPGDSAKITLQYITPNFDTLNIDTLIIAHNGFGENPITIPLSGTFDSLKTSKIIIDNLYVNGKLFTSEDYLFSENKSISFSLLENLFDDNENLIFKINYYRGGPSVKQTAINGGVNKFIIPFKNVTNTGLLFKGELFTKTQINSSIDSVSIFDFKNAQIIFDNYTTPEIAIPKSTAGNTADEATAKWVLFGFPFEGVVSDSVFGQFGGINNMEDGEWIVYNYENDLTGFNIFNKYSFSKGSGYFVAQSLLKDFNISYNYKNPILSKKLSGNKITLSNSDNWNTVTNPFTFPVEVDTPAVLYKYDSNNLRYSLTRIMRTGEAYFVEPTISELNLKTYGEYYPNLFPKISEDINWSVTLVFNGEKENDEIVVSLLDNEKRKSSKKLFLNPPNISNNFDAYITTNNSTNKYHAVFTSGSEGAIWNVHLVSLKGNDNISISTIISDDFPEYFSVLFLDEHNIQTEELSLLKGEDNIYKLIIGTDKFIKETKNSLVSIMPNYFELLQNYPNPFNPSTIIKYSIPENENLEATITKLVVFDVLGREIVTLVNEAQNAGNYEVLFDARGLTSGLYFYKINYGSFTKTRKMLLIK